MARAGWLCAAPGHGSHGDEGGTGHCTLGGEGWGGGAGRVARGICKCQSGMEGCWWNETVNRYSIASSDSFAQDRQAECLALYYLYRTPGVTERKRGREEERKRGRRKRRRRKRRGGRRGPDELGVLELDRGLALPREVLLDHLGRHRDQVLPLPVLDQPHALQRRDDVVCPLPHPQSPPRVLPRKTHPSTLALALVLALGLSRALALALAVAGPGLMAVMREMSLML
eukprot:2717868-Rhodomonas_salina.1